MAAPKKPEVQDGTASDAERRKKGGTGLNDVFIAIFGVAFLLSVSLNLLHSTGRIDNVGGEVDAGHHGAIGRAVKEFKMNDKTRKSLQEMVSKRLKAELKKKKEHVNNRRDEEHEALQQAVHDEKASEDVEESNHDAVPPEMKLDENHDQASLGTLRCEAHGGPSQEQAQEMVYWMDIPSDSKYVSPFHNGQKHTGGSKNSVSEGVKYMTFEPDGGGWNNIRMAMESVIGLAVAMGRTLVMPPEKRMYLLGRGDNKQRNHFSFVDFFPIEEVAAEHEGLDVISMEEYLKTVAMTGQLRDKDTGEVSFPPGNRTDWNGLDQANYDILREYLRQVAYTPVWIPGKCLPAFPRSGNHKDVEELQNMVEEINREKNPKDKDVDKFAGNPVPVDAPAKERLEENLAGRTKLCVYDEELQKAPTLHFQCNHKLKIRMLVHFYAFLFFEDWITDLWMKRFVRDHIRYTDEIQCAAARIVKAVREHARKRDPVGNPDGIFDTFHLRRGDFQFKATRIPAEEIVENSKDELTPNTTIFIATDERDKNFFKPLKDRYDVLFLDDFKKELEGVNTNYYGMIDQLVASRGRIFFGCFYSTFTGFINRIRGYHSTAQKLEGYESGALPKSFYYATLNKKFIMHEYASLRGAFFNREFPVSWRNLDYGIGQPIPTADQ